MLTQKGVESQCLFDYVVWFILFNKHFEHIKHQYLN